MGWIFAVVLFVVGSIRGDAGILIAAGVFGIAGAIGSVSVSLDKRRDKDVESSNSNGVAK